MESIKLSIGVITFGRAPLLRNALDSLLSQLQKGVELIILVDGKDPETEALLGCYRNQFIRILYQTENRGRPVSRNRVIREAVGEYILWIDDDDLAKPDLVSTYLNLLSNTDDIDIAYCDLEVFDPYCKKKQYILSAEHIGGCASQILQNLVSGKGITSGGAIIRRSLYHRLGMFDENFLKSQDNEFWYRAALVARFQKVNKTLYTYNLHSGSGSNVWNRDNTYASLAIRKTVQNVPLEIIYPDYNWDDITTSLSKALTHISEGLALQGDYYNSGKYISRIPFAWQRPQQKYNMVRFALICGEKEKARYLCEWYRKHILYETETFERCEQLVNEMLDLEGKIRQSYDENDVSSARKLLKKYYKRIGPTFFSCCFIAERFEAIGDTGKAFRAMLMAVRYQPDNEQVYAWLINHAKSERQVEETLLMRQRVRGTNTDAPLYLLSSLQKSPASMKKGNIKLVQTGT